MKSSTKALLLGAVIGTFTMGPGLGTVLGAAAGARQGATADRRYDDEHARQDDQHRYDDRKAS